MLLDEPAVAIDTASEVVVQQAMDNVVTGKTVGSSRTRLSTMVGSNQTLVFEEGKRCNAARTRADRAGRAGTGICGA